MTKKGHQKVLTLKSKFFLKRRSFKIFPFPQTRRQVSAYAKMRFVLWMIRTQNTFKTIVFRSSTYSFIHSFIHTEHLYSASSRELLRGAPDSSTSKKSSLK